MNDKYTTPLPYVCISPLMGCFNECPLYTESGRSDVTPAAAEAGCLGAKRRPGFPKDCAC